MRHMCFKELCQSGLVCVCGIIPPCYSTPVGKKRCLCAHSAIISQLFPSTPPGAHHAHLKHLWSTPSHQIDQYSY